MLASGLLFGGTQAWAAAPPANTVIGNQATANYLDPNGLTQSATSNIVQTTVQQVGSFNLDGFTSETTTVQNTKTGAAGSIVYAPHVLTNTGNGTDTFAIKVTNPGPNGSGTLANIAVYADANFDGLPDSTTALCSVTPNPGGVCDVPAQSVAGNNGKFGFVVAYALPATVNSSLTPYASATVLATASTTALYTATKAANVDNINTTTAAAFNLTKAIQQPSTGINAPGGGAWPTAAATGKRSLAGCATTWAAGMTSTANCQYTVYTLTYSNTGGAPGRFVMQDVIGTGSTAGLKYVAGSAVWSGASGTAMGDGAGSDPAGVDYAFDAGTNTITFVDNTLPVSTPRSISFVVLVTNTPNAATGIDGVVFRDTGSGGGVANDGLRNGSEAAVAGVTVRLTDCASTVYATATTDAAGAFGFADPGLATSASLCVEETNVAAASVSTGASVMGTALPSGTATSVGGTSYTYTRAGSPDRIAFAWNGTGHSGLAFGDVPDNTFIGNGARKTAPGTSTTYAHTFTAGTAGTVLFDIAGATATPTIGGWSEKIYDDVGCTGKLQASATLLYPPAGSGTAVVAGQNVCIVVQESTPAAAQTGNKNEAQVRAGFTHANAGPTLSASYSVLDTTEVDSSALGLTKEVRNLTTGGPWGTSNQAKSGEVLEYRVTYTNNSLATMSAFAVNDATPQYTTFQSAAAGTTPAALGNCTKATPQNAAPAAQVACSTVQATGGSGAVRWVFDGVLGPSATGDVRMTVVVD